MKYITYKRFKNTAFCGEVNISALTDCEEKDGIIYCENYPICSSNSENAHQYFARNDDNNGLLRGQLTHEIQRVLAKKDSLHEERLEKILDDPICNQYRRTEHSDVWLWNHDFYNAEISDLKYIANLINIKIKEVKA